MKGELREYIRQERSVIQKARYKREVKLKILPGETSRRLTGGEKQEFCENCGETLSGERRKYCTTKCQNEFILRQQREGRAALRPVKTCSAPNCENSYIQRRHDHLYCSRSCSYKVWYAKQKGIKAQQERDEQLEMLTGY